jgi:hypothetical protein
VTSIIESNLALRSVVVLAAVAAVIFTVIYSEDKAAIYLATKWGIPRLLLELP